MSIKDLNEAERAVWSAYSRGAWVDLRTGDPDADRLDGASAWPQSRVVRAEVMSALLLGAAGALRGRFPALRLRGARIAGRLDLTGATVEHAIAYEHCVFEEEPCFVDATTKTIRIVECLLPSFSGARLRADGIVDFSGSVVERSVFLDRATIVGELCLRGVTVGRDPAAVALSAEGVSVDGLVDLSGGFTCTGQSLLRGARITGSLDLADASLTAAGTPALRADNTIIGGRLSGTRMKAAGEVRLSNTRIGGWLNLLGAQLRNPGDVALGGGGLSVGGGVWCRLSFLARGEMRLIGAHITGNLNLIGADLSHPGGAALNLDRATLGDVDAIGIHVTDSRVSMRNAQITGRVSLMSAHLDAGVGQTALAASGVVIAGALDLRELRARGTLTLRTCSIGERILLSDAVLDNGPGIAMRLSRARIAADMFCRAMTVHGTLRLSGATIGSHILLTDVALDNPGQIALDAESLRAGSLTLRPRERIRGTVLLRGAQLTRLIDAPDQWPDELVLDGCTYGDLEPRLPARDRLRWLDREPDGFQSQPYEQLAAWYTSNGQPSEARRVLHAKERRVRAAKPLSGRIWGLLQDVTVAYGYQPWRAVLWLLGLLAAGSITYSVSPPPPLDPAQAPHFNAVVYALDLLLPVVDLGQKHAYNPAGAEQWLSYALIASGWILVTTIAAGAARTLNRG